MCSCDESASSWPSCLTHAPRNLIGVPDWRYLSARDLADTGDWTDQEVEEGRREAARSQVDFESPWRDA